MPLCGRIDTSGATAGWQSNLVKGVSGADAPTVGAALARCRQRWGRAPRQPPPHAAESHHATRSRRSRHRRGCHNQAMAGAEVRRWEAARGGGAGRRRGGATSLVRGVGVGAVGEAAT